MLKNNGTLRNIFFANLKYSNLSGESVVVKPPQEHHLQQKFLYRHIKHLTCTQPVSF